MDSLLGFAQVIHAELVYRVFKYNKEFFINRKGRIL